MHNRPRSHRTLIAAGIGLTLTTMGAPAAHAISLASPDWEMVLSDAGYSDYLGDLSPGFAGREYLSGEWGAAIAYGHGSDSSSLKPTWLESNFIYPDWATNSNFTSSGTNQISTSSATSTITNPELSIRQTFDILDTRIGTPMGISAASTAGTGASLMSNRYVLRQSYSITNTTPDTIDNVQFFQFLHNLNGQAGVYDNRAYSGALSNYKYDVTLWGQDDTASTGQFDYIGFHSALAPSAVELGHYGIEPIDSHSIGKPENGVHLSIEENSLNGNDSFAPAQRWIAGAQRWNLGSLAAGQTTTMDVLLSIRTGWTVAPNIEGGSSGGSNGSGGTPGRVDYSFSDVSSGHLFVEYEIEDIGGIKELVDLGQFGTPTFASLGGKYQLFNVEYDGKYSGKVDLTFTYDASLLPPSTDESSLHVFHWHNSQWEDLNGVVDPSNHTIKFTTDSLSPFAVAPVPEAETWALMITGLGVVGFAARRGKRAG